MVKVSEEIYNILREKELTFYIKALENSDIPEIKHWEKVVKSRTKKLK